MDVLSKILSAVRLTGAVFFHGEFSAPWCVSSSGTAGIRAYLPSEDAHLITFHFLTEGRAYAALTNGERVELNEGDIVIFPQGDAHLLGNGPAQRPVDSFKAFEKNLAEGLKVVRYGGGGEITRFVCGYMACDPQLSEMLLRGLPKILRVPVAAGPSGRWIENSIRFSVGASGDSDAGSSLVVEKLSEVLFIETLRNYIAMMPPDLTGLFAGMRDPVLNKALACLHHDPAEQWTVEKLAREVGSSRTRLAERFRYYLQMSPIAYLAEWRMKLGAEALRTSQKSVAEIAFEVGYSSESAFSRAFKRAFQISPLQFRQSNKADQPA